MRRTAGVIAALLVLAGCGSSDDGIHVRDDERPASSVPSKTAPSSDTDD